MPPGCEAQEALLARRCLPIVRPASGAARAPLSDRQDTPSWSLRRSDQAKKTGVTVVPAARPLSVMDASASSRVSDGL